MAVDRALLEARAAGAAPPTLRLYRWARPTVSLGRFQTADDVDRGFCEAHGIDVCRRPTGGRGVLHDDEVTYAVVAGIDDGLPRGVTASYRVLSGALVLAFRALGVEADLVRRPAQRAASGACYLHATAADLSVGAAKLSGSAQVWLKDACLQHGSFVLTRKTALEAAVFALDEAQAEALARSTRTIAEASGRRPDEADVERAVCEGFSRAFGVSLDRGELTREEFAQAAMIRERFCVL